MVLDSDRMMLTDTFSVMNAMVFFVSMIFLVIFMYQGVLFLLSLQYLRHIPDLFFINLKVIKKTINRTATDIIDYRGYQILYEKEFFLTSCEINQIFKTDF